MDNQPVPKFQRVKNKLYREFLDNGLIQTIPEAEFNNMLNGVNGKHGKSIKEARALCIALYYTGARPVQILRQTGRDYTREKNFLIVKCKPAKKGMPSTIYLNINKPMVKELSEYALGVYPDLLLFRTYANKYTRLYISKKKEVKEIISNSDKLRYYFKKWFKTKDIVPYFLRHNRFSRLAENGATMEQLRMMKGARSFNSVTPYLHLSTDTAKSVSKHIN